MSAWIVGNWKMNGSRAMVETYARELLAGLPKEMAARGVRAAVCPPLPYLAPLGERLAGSEVALGAQDVHPMAEGAFTGEVSPAMLKDLGVTVCIIGHSERRLHMGVTDAFIAQKLHAVLAADIVPILCVGETLGEREADRQEEVIQRQVLQALMDSEGVSLGRRKGDAPLLKHPALPQSAAAKLTIAYEPVWAIGTGRNATPEQANTMHRFIRQVLAERYPGFDAQQVPVLYGGSVSPANAAELLAQPEIDGALVGGASLKAESFLDIIAQGMS